jgi:hypothetical protein
MGLHGHNELPRHNGLPLSDAQIAGARLLSVGFSEFSDAVHCAGWMRDVEHEIWEWLHPTLETTNWNKEFLMTEEAWPYWFELARGIGLLGEMTNVWLYWDEDNADTAIHLTDWKEMHAAWCARIISGS